MVVGYLWGHAGFLPSAESLLAWHAALALHPGDAVQSANMPMACGAHVKRRAPACLRCRWLSTRMCLLILVVGLAECHSWLRECMAVEPQRPAPKTRTCSELFLYGVKTIQLDLYICTSACMNAGMHACLRALPRQE